MFCVTCVRFSFIYFEKKIAFHSLFDIFFCFYFSFFSSVSRVSIFSPECVVKHMRWGNWQHRNCSIASFKHALSLFYHFLLISSAFFIFLFFLLFSKNTFVLQSYSSSLFNNFFPLCVSLVCVLVFCDIFSQGDVLSLFNVFIYLSLGFWQCLNVRNFKQNFTCFLVHCISTSLIASLFSSTSRFILMLFSCVSKFVWMCNKLISRSLLQDLISYSK